MVHRRHNSSKARLSSGTFRQVSDGRGESGSPRNSPYRELDEESYWSDFNNPSTSVKASTSATPRTLEDGNQQQAQQASYRASIQVDHISLPKRPPVQSEDSSPNASSTNLLPQGASTPHPDSDTPVVTFPPAPPTWLNMPNKGQLAILSLSRFVDFFQMAAMQTYMVHQLKSFAPDTPDSTISHQAGMLQGSFTAAQIITSILWGRAADQPGVGRKLVLNIGLIGTGFCMIGVGFSTSFHQAVFWRVLGGAVNGTVGAARTMVAESVDKRWHPRAFLLLPAAFNVANVLGPILSGLLSEPVKSYPQLFGPGGTFGGPTGVLWMETYPYALANLLSTVLLWIEAAICIVGLKETLRGFRAVDVSVFNPIYLAKLAYSKLRSAKSKGYALVNESRRGLLSGDAREGSIELQRMAGADSPNPNGKGYGDGRVPPRLPFRRIWTSNVCWTLLSIAIFDFHMGAFSTLWILFLSAAREYVPPTEIGDDGIAAPNKVVRGVFKFAGGLAFPPPTIGFAMAIIGFIGIALQFLLYPWANGRFGLMRCFRGALFLFPLAYFLAPYIALLPSSSESPAPASGFWIWLGIAFVVLLQVAARTFALPASIILLNNASPHPSVLATIHGLGQADSAAFRTFGPIVSAYWFGTWLERGVVGMAWWYVALISAIGTAASFKVRNGTGHEILLEGEEDEALDGLLPKPAVAPRAMSPVEGASSGGDGLQPNPRGSMQIQR